MNLYDAYMTTRDRTACEKEDLAVLAEIASPLGRGSTPPPSPRPGRPVPPPRPGQPTPPPPPADGEMHGNPGGRDSGRDCNGGYPSLAMVYAPEQCFRMLYEPDRALSRGTLFSELDKPFEGGWR